MVESASSCAAKGGDSEQSEGEGLHTHEGILPLAKSIKVMGYGWLLPGHGESYADCGAWRYEGCLNVDQHTQEGLFEGMVGKVYVRVFKRSCARAECPTCYEKWAGKEALKIEWRLLSWYSSKNVIHVIASCPHKIKNGFFGQMRRECYSVLKKAGFIGGSVIFHPFRQRKKTKEWYWSPHFHCLGYGWIKNTKALYEATGWVVKNAGLRKTISGTALYQLSHCGVHEKLHSVTWFGALAYNKLRVLPLPEKEKEICPMCGEELRPLWYFGAQKLPEEEGFFWFEADGWEYKPLRGFGG